MKKGKKWICICLIACSLLGICGCGEPEIEPIGSVEFPYKISEELDIPRQVQLPDNPSQLKEIENPGLAEIEQLPAAVNQFAFRMYEQLGTEDDIFFSPYSLCSALSLLNVGAGTQTKEEIEQMLGIEDIDIWNLGMLTFLERQWTDDTFVITANSIWMDKSKEFAETMEAEFLQPATDYYKSELYTGDFRNNPEEVIKQINLWAEENTNGMISKIIEKFPPHAVMALLNAVYFEGKWENEFKEDNTFEETFCGTNGETQIEMMHQYHETYSYIEFGDMKGIALPYKGEEVVMKVFIPMEDGDDIADLFATLSDEEKQQMLDSLDNCTKREIRQLAIPKFTMEKSIDNLPEILATMGMENAFNPETADFDKICEDLYVSDVLHKAKIEVDEEGTRAAAVTAVVTSDTAAVIEPVFYDFVADKPFVYVLQDTKTGIILFMGRVNNL